ncbi:AfsR/SARP family transcriptional regulator [Phytoactinopolyspora limicola]|uniref:AfsR/SARP family transcriptional regulator n=1 Tax=Phytoactinopolyspora limicola TaxID=2715536 RepID=UPI00140E31B3|nr:BTAD domain-containing putative transcriptional regulator [Phytoactinopolyspora limicola]
MRFGILGPLAVWSSAGHPVTVPELKTRALLADLLVNVGRVVSAERLIDDVWGAQLPENPVNALHGKVSQLRRTLEAVEPGGRHLVVSRAPGYLLDVDDEVLDASRFQRLISQAREHVNPRDRAALLADALALWRGPVLADFADAEFVRPAATELDEQRLVAVEDQAAARLELGEHPLLVGELSDLVDRHPLRERLRELHMRALYQSGRQSEALASFTQLQTRLREDLGVDPGPAVTGLHQAILRQDESLTTAAVPSTARSTIPVPLTELIGRSDEVAAVSALLRAHRLVTLTGPGGVGKTRLAVEIARESSTAWTDGVHVVELAAADHSATDASTRDPNPAGISVSELVAVTLGIREGGTAGGTTRGRSGGPVDRLAEALAGQRLLLVLDNCEQLIGPVAELAERLLAAAPGVRILATSQEPLRAHGEVVWPVPPLALPDPAEPIDPASLGRYPAVDLFVERATAATPGFTLDAGNADAVVTICRRLDGVPLALELAAARVPALGVHDLAARLDDRFRVLTTGRRQAPGRQQTLRAVIDWSWELLTDPERALLRRLAVHPAGSTLAAAEVVGAGGDVAREDVADLLARLVDRSLVMVVDPGHGERRFHLLESVQAYCLERLLEAGEHLDVRGRQLRYQVELAERAEPHLYGPHQREWMERLDAESANIRMALDTAAQMSAATLALRLGNALTWYWVVRGRIGELLRSLGLALSVAGPAPEAIRARAVVWRAALTFGAGDHTDWAELSRTALPALEQLDDPIERARGEWALGYSLVSVGTDAEAEGAELLERAWGTFRSAGDRWGMATVLAVRGAHAPRRQDLTTAIRDSEQSLVWFREAGDQWGQAMAGSALGDLALRTGDYGQAARHLRAALRISEELGLWADASFVLSSLGRVALLTGDTTTAEELYGRARRLAVEHFIPVAVELAEVGLGAVARRNGDLEAAEERFHTWLGWNRDVHAHDRVAEILIELGRIAVARQTPDSAVAFYEEASTSAAEAADPWLQALAMEGLAGVYVDTGAHHEAVRWLAEAAALRAATNVPPPPAERDEVDRLGAEAVAVLGTEVVAGAYRAAGAPHPPGGASGAQITP